MVSPNTEKPNPVDPSDEITELPETVDGGYVYDTYAIALVDTLTEGD